MRRTVRAATSVILVLNAVGAVDTTVATSRTFSISDSVESARLLDFAFEGNVLQWSPDLSRYLLMVARADLQRDGLWVDFLTGDPHTPSAPPRSALKLFTRALGNMPVTYNNSVSWLRDGASIAFQWEDKRGLRQVMALDLATRVLRQLTYHTTNVNQFVVSPNGKTVVYTAFAPHDDLQSEQMRREGFAVMNTDGYAFLRGEIDGWDAWEHVELFVAGDAGREPQRITIPNRRGAMFTSLMEFSPDERHVVMFLPCDAVPDAWGHYSNAWLTDVVLPEARRNARHSQLFQLHIVDSVSRSVQPAWNAPQKLRERLVWAPDGKSFIIGPTFLPLEIPNALGTKGMGVAEVNLLTRAVAVLPVPSQAAGSEGFEPVSWSGTLVELASRADPNRRLSFKKVDARWRNAAQPGGVLTAKMKVPIGLHEDLNTSPTLVATDEQVNRAEILFALNPYLHHRFTLGRVELMHWSSEGGRKWTGRLYYPVHFRADRRFPLVIQTHGDTPQVFSAFSLIGDDHYPSVFAAQALANRDIAVLQMGDPDAYSQETVPFGEEGRIYQGGFESGVDRLVDAGLVDKLKVGLSGFSRTGWHVEYAIAHSDFPFAAAIADDNIDAGYMQAALGQWPEEYSADNGGEPFGDGLHAWLKETPGFNAHRIRTPLRLQVNGGGVTAALSHWELFSRLTRLRKPVELYMIPNIEQGTHNLQNPRQLIASAGGAVDWFDFWLNGYECPDPAKAAQYARWERLLRLAIVDPRDQ